jgi:DNA-3-methyladenine glycosylase
MFGSPGVAYVYLVYGMHNCLNVVTEADGRPAALLIRAMEPVCGADGMRSSRLGLTRAGAAGRERTEALQTSRLAAGPGLVCAALSVDRSWNGADLCDPTSDLRLEMAPDDEAWPVATAPRVGIAYAPEPWLSMSWRFFVPGNPSLSVTK